MVRRNENNNPSAMHLKARIFPLCSKLCTRTAGVIQSTPNTAMLHVCRLLKTNPTERVKSFRKPTLYPPELQRRGCFKFRPSQRERINCGSDERLTLLCHAAQRIRSSSTRTCEALYSFLRELSI